MQMVPTDKHPPFEILLLKKPSRLPGMSHLSTSLRSETEKYKKAARKINIDALIRQWAPIGAIGFIFIIFIWWRFF